MIGFKETRILKLFQVSVSLLKSLLKSNVDEICRLIVSKERLIYQQRFLIRLCKS